MSFGQWIVRKVTHTLLARSINNALEFSLTFLPTPNGRLFGEDSEGVEKGEGAQFPEVTSSSP